MKLTLNALFDYTNNDGIFTYLNGQNVPWKESIDADVLDLDYHSKHGTRIVSKTVTSLLDDDGLSTSAKQKLAKLLYTKNKAKWDELWNSMSLYDEFNPLDNTNYTETMTTTHEGEDSRTQNIGQKQTTYNEGQQVDTFNKGAQSNSFTKGSQENTFNKGAQSNSSTIGQETLTEGAQSNTIGTHTDSKTITKSAYNSSNYSPDTKEEDVVGAHTDSYGQKVNTNSGHSDSSTEGSRLDSTTEGQRSDSSSEGAREDSTTKGARQDTTTEGAQVNTDEGSNSFTDTTTITKAGNIGVTSSGQLIRDFRQTVDWQYFEIIYKDIDDILCIEVYGCDSDDFSDYNITTPYKLPIASAQKLGGIKVGENLTIASDGTLNAQGGGAVDSVNGKTGEVTLDYSDVGAASASDMTTAKADIVNIKLDINQLQGSVLDLTNRTSTNEGDIVNIKLDINQLQGSVLGLHNDLLTVRQVPNGGTEGQVLTKGASGYDWQTPSGGGDIPSYDSTKAGRALKVNSAGDGLVWSALRELPVIYAAVAGKILSNNGSAAQWVNAPLQKPVPKSKMHLLQGYISTPTSGANQGLSVWNVESRGITLMIDVSDYEGQFLSAVFTSKTNKINRYIAGRFTKLWNELQGVSSWTDTLPIVWNSTESGLIYYPTTGAAAGWAGGNSHSWQSGYCNDYKNIYIPSGCKTIGFFYSWDLSATTDLSDLVVKVFVETESPTT